MELSNDDFSKAELKVRAKAQKNGLDVSSAVMVFTCLVSDDESPFSTLFGIIYPDRVVKWQKRMTGVNSEEIPIKNVTSVEVSGGLLKTVKVYASGNTISFKLGIEAEKAAQTIREMVSKSSEKSAAPNISPTQADGIVSQIEKLVTLLEKGYLTQEEFEKQKQQILNG